MATAVRPSPSPLVIPADSDCCQVDGDLQVPSPTPFASRGSPDDDTAASPTIRVGSFLSRLLRRTKSRSSRVEPLVSPRGGQEFFGKYRLGDVLGKGSFGVVRRCTNISTGLQVACKVICKTSMQGKDEEDAVQREVEALLLLRPHPHIISLQETFEDMGAIYLVMELCPGGELYDRLAVESVMSAERAATVFLQLVRAVAHCHRHGILHRDIKLENVLIASLHPPVVKLADFGSSSRPQPPAGVVTPRSSSSLVGSLLYQAPEVLRQRRYSPASDMWALGVVLHALLSGGLPFVAETESSQQRAVRKGADLSGPAWFHVAEGAKGLVRRLLEVEAGQRPTAEQVERDEWLVRAAGGV